MTLESDHFAYGHIRMSLAPLLKESCGKSALQSCYETKLADSNKCIEGYERHEQQALGWL